MTLHGHDHAHHHSHAHAPRHGHGRAFLIGIVLNVLFVAFEYSFGVMAHSLALLADATHNLGDVLSLIIAWGASVLAQRRPTERFTYGLRGSSILAALANAVLLLLVTGGLALEAIERFNTPQQVAGDVVIAVAACGVVVNGITAWLFMAPFAGTILQTHVEPGDLVTANTRILTVANLQTLQIVAAVDETTIRQIAAGQTAQVTFDAFPGRTLRGQVASVPLQGTLQGDVMVYSVPITLTGAVDLPLLVGMTANVKVELGQATNALLVPTMALQRSGGLVQVLVPNPNDPTAEPQAVPVEIGLSDGVNTQIVRGLNPGDKVVVQIAATQSTNPFNFRGVGGDAPRIQPIGR